jgi:hypothetical protein
MNPLPTKPNRWRPITVFNLLVGLFFSLSAQGQSIVTVVSNSNPNSSHKSVTKLQTQLNSITPSTKSSETQISRTTSRKSPEEQFTDFQKKRMGSNVNITNVTMKIKSKNENKILYEGFYQHQLNLKGLIGAKKETAFFTAIFVDGKMTEWIPTRS